MLQHTLVRGIARQVEVGVVGHVDDRRSRSRGLVGDVDLVVLGQGVRDIGFHFAREIVVTVGGDAEKLHMGGVGLDALIHLVLPAGGAAVEAVAEIVLRKLVFHAVQGDLALVDAVRIPADGGAEIRLVVLREIVGNLVEAEDDVLHVPLVVRDQDGDDAAAEVGDAHFHAVGIGQGVQGGGHVVVGGHEVFRVQAGGRQGGFLLLVAARDKQSGAEQDQ